MVVIIAIAQSSFAQNNIRMQVRRSFTVDSLGACQGVSYQNGKLYLYGDRETGMIREYLLQHDSLEYTHNEYLLTQSGKDIINHPTGIAFNGSDTIFMGNSIRLNAAGTAWKAVIYSISRSALFSTHTLDNSLLRTIEDDTCIQGTRPEYVQYQGHWYVATADYGNKNNEVRLYRPAALAKAGRTSDAGVLYKKFSCGPWVQNLCWIPGKNLLLLVQNQTEGRQWRFSFVDLAQSLSQGKAHVLATIDIDKPDELEGFCLLPGYTTGIAVTSSRKENVHIIDMQW